MIPASILLVAAFLRVASGVLAVHFGNEIEDLGKRLFVSLCVISLHCFGLGFSIIRDLAMELLQ